jgi:lauroyl/myristoyl acyltransferase
VRFLGMRLVLTPAAWVLPRGLALALARWLALLLLPLPSAGLAADRRMRRAFGTSRWKSWLLTWGWLARTLYDFVVLKRVLNGREDPRGWRIVERNAEGISGLRESGASYIVVTGHYAKGPSLALYAPHVTPGHPVQVANPLREQLTNLFERRIRTQYEPFVRACYCWERDFEYVFIKDVRSGWKLSKVLREPGNVVFMPIDAPWRASATGAFARPFAGAASYVFSTGAAQLARLARCPIITCIPILERDGTMVLEWGTPMRVGEVAGDDVAVMSRLLDVLERAVGERPTQYVYEIGGDRRWNAQTGLWDAGDT